MRLRAGGLGAAASVIALGAVAPSGAAAATTSAEAVAYLNVQRTLNGIPEVVPSATHDKGCANHNAYMGLNGFQHGETPGNPGYTPEGAGVANKNELLIRGVHPWTATLTPWIDAPLHEYLEFDARRTQAGYAEGSGYSCLRLTGDRAPRSPQTFAFTGSDPLATRPAVRGVDFPFAPQELAGIPAGTITGPNIYLYVLGFGTGLAIKSATLTGPSGPVPVATVSQRTPGGEVFFYGGGVMIPKTPLTAGAAYSANVVWQNPAGRTLSQSVGFLSSGGEPALGRLAQASVGSGIVKIKEGRRWVRLRGSKIIPIGALLDTRRGTVGLTTATPNGSQAGQFGGSIFRLLQSKDPALGGLAEMRLAGGSFRRCGKASAKRATTSASKKKRTIRKLRGNAHGKFRTRGRRAAATVRGTAWTVADRCDGTLTSVSRGVVDVQDFVRKRTVSVTAGHRYLARNKRK